MPCLPGLPPERTGLSAGSTARTNTEESRSFKYAPTPLMVAPLATASIKASMRRPSVPYRPRFPARRHSVKLHTVRILELVEIPRMPVVLVFQTGLAHGFRHARPGIDGIHDRPVSLNLGQLGAGNIRRHDDIQMIAQDGARHGKADAQRTGTASMTAFFPVMSPRSFALRTQ